MTKKSYATTLLLTLLIVTTYASFDYLVNNNVNNELSFNVAMTALGVAFSGIVFWLFTTLRQNSVNYDTRQQRKIEILNLCTSLNLRNRDLSKMNLSNIAQALMNYLNADITTIHYFSHPDLTYRKPATETHISPDTTLQDGEIVKLLFSDNEKHSLTDNHKNCHTHTSIANPNNSINRTCIPVSPEGKLIASIDFFTRDHPDLDTRHFLETVRKSINNNVERDIIKSTLDRTIQRLEKSQAIARIGSWEWHPDCGQCYWSSQIFELFGFEAGNFTPSIDALIELAHFSERRRLQRFFENLKSGTTQKVQIHAQTLNGDPLNICLIGEKCGEYICGIVQDVSEQQQLDKLKADFISTISHELRTPLTAIKGSLTLIDSMATGTSTEGNQHLLDIARNNVERLLFLVNDILDLEKASSGEIQLALQNVSLRSLINDAAKQMQHYASQFNGKLSLDLPDSEIIANIDPNRVMQSLINLISNALKYSPDNSEVIISLKMHDKRARIMVSDQGMGIPENMRERIFDRFSQINSREHKKAGGSGLGLSIAKMFIEKHGGNLNFFHNQDGKGTTFYIDLNAVHGETRLNSDTTQHSTGEKTVLVIEDDSSTSRYLEALLKRLGLSTTVANSIAQARQALECNNFDLITIDIMLPDQNGLDFVRELTTTKHKNTPVIVISAIADIMRSKNENRDLSVHQWFTKPIKQSEFIKTIGLIRKETRIKKIQTG